MEKINGIIVSGKVYVAYPSPSGNCIGCTFSRDSVRIAFLETDVCDPCKNKYIFRYSPELTDKINKI